MAEENNASMEGSQMTRVASCGRIILFSLATAGVEFVVPVAAQQGGGAGNVCDTQMGGFINAVTSSAGTLAIAAIVIAILVGVAARPFIRSGHQASALNGIMSNAFAGLVILIIAIPIITWGLSFTPFAPTMSCIPFLGG